MSVRNRRDSGAVLIVVAFSMVALLLIVAIVIDLGFTRSDRRQIQSAADSAASSAGVEFANNDNAVTACRAAFEYLGASLETTFDSSACSSSFGGECNNASARQTPLIKAGQFTAQVVNPVLDTSPLFTTAGVIGASSVAKTTGDGTSCQRFGVLVESGGNSFFGGIGGQTKRPTSVHAVARVTPGFNDLGVPAFLMLERKDCGALIDNMTSDMGITVLRSVDGKEPGLIQVDSYATGSCGGDTKGVAVFGKEKSSPKRPSITVQGTLTATPPSEGQINIVASTPAKAYDAYPGGLSVKPLLGVPYVSRAPVDRKYNGPNNKAIIDLHSDAYTALTTNFGYTDVGCATSVPATSPPTTKIVVTCPKFEGSATFAGATDIVFVGNINLKSGDTLNLTGAERVYVRGNVAINSGGLLLPKVQDFFVSSNISMGKGGRLGVNSSSNTECIPTATATRMVVFGTAGPTLALQDSAALCRTTGYLAGPLTATYAIQEERSTSVHISCAQKPCPKVTSNAAAGAEFSIQGGTLLWTAPNNLGATTAEDIGLEDLAVWSEASGVFDIKSGASLQHSGVMFVPNGAFEVRSPSDATPSNAQFIARRLQLNQGNLNMQPALKDSIQIPAPGKVGLIR